MLFGKQHDKRIRYLVDRYLRAIHKIERNWALYCVFVSVGGLVFKVHATGPKVRGSIIGRGLWIFKGDKNPYYEIIGGEVKPSVLFAKFCVYVEELCRVWKTNFVGKFTDIPCQVSPNSLLGIYWYVHRKLWRIHQEWLELRWRTVDQKTTAVSRTLWKIPPRSSDQ
jgi:hypothetical protein